MKRAHRLTPQAAPVLPEWIVTTNINTATREFVPGDPITPDDLDRETWDALVACARIIKPAPPAPPRKKGLYRVAAPGLSTAERRWKPGDFIRPGDVDTATFKAARRDRVIVAVGDPVTDRAARAKAESDRLMSRLDAHQRHALDRAYSGAAPAILGWSTMENEADGMAVSIKTIETAARAMLSAEPRNDWPDWQKELPRLLEWIEDWRTARTAGHLDSVGILAMSIGMMFTRLAFMLLAGENMAAGATWRLAREKANAERDLAREEIAAAWIAEALRLDADLRARRPTLKSKEVRAKHIRDAVGDWMIRDGNISSPDDAPSVGTIRRVLPAVK